ncbi:MAG: hypothetical protein A2X34_01000 [Elusimicrobia bacterium GWC2_51_8]|nr:MAG: hypothetical protein A2X34_01000 [Elusimicrobia bacterium GWC2_51_8]OGR85853.1 MAG: hypothetical protein A2021_03410 [Elusimicrobia bacterium GWF2_52_66]HAF95728.1 hypothetical protein [Elusimicrobiota bacterium]
MKKFTFVCAAAFFFLPVKAFCGEFKDSGAVFSVDFPSGWTQGKSNDPSATLRLEKGAAFFEFARLDSELSDYYLKARVKEQVDSLRSKGTSLAGEIKSVSLHGVSSAYYASYESLGAYCYMAFFTYNGVSYAVSSSGSGEADFRAVMGTLRKPGEKIEFSRPPKPKKIRATKNKQAAEDESGVQIFKEDDPVPSTLLRAKKARADENKKAAEDESAVQILKEDTEAVFTASGAVAAAASQAENAPAAPALSEKIGALCEKTNSFLSELAAKTASAGKAPYLDRKPVSIFVWGVAILLWLTGSFVAIARAGVYQNPKLLPPSKDVPPDFFFPFLVSRLATLKDVTYNITTRQKQHLQAGFSSGHEMYFVAAVYGALMFNFVWSLLAFSGRSGLIVNGLLALPGGRFFASFPEVVFLIPLLIGLVKYGNKKHVLQLFDAQSNLVLEVKREVSYGLLRDDNGKEIARLVAKTGDTGRMWEYVDSDNMVVFSIRDDCPGIHFMRHVFGNLGGALRARYGIFVQERRAGFVFLDPNSSNKFQIHLDFNFARLAHPAHILASCLYIISREKDPVYPSPF